MIGILLGFVCITRPEGAFFTIITAANLFLFTRVDRRQILPLLIVLCAIPFIFFCAQLGFRLAYYHEWLPNTYYAKVAGPTFSRLVNGGLYCFKALASFLPVLLIILLLADKLREARYVSKKRVILFFLAYCAEWLTVLILNGGDIEPGYRHMLMIVPLMIIILMECADISYDTGVARKTHIFFALVIACFAWTQLTFDENKRAYNDQWEWKAKELGEWLYRHYYDKQPLIAVSAGGAIPFYSKLPALEVFGLTDRYLTRHPGELFGHGYLGHELFNAEYVLKRKPDMVIFYIGQKEIGICRSLSQNPEFLAQYKTVTIPLPSYDAEIWVRKDSKKVR
jgi:hypothetical protein